MVHHAGVGARSRRLDVEREVVPARPRHVTVHLDREVRVEVLLVWVLLRALTRLRRHCVEPVQLAPPPRQHELRVRGVDAGELVEALLVEQPVQAGDEVADGLAIVGHANDSIIGDAND